MTCKYNIASKNKVLLKPVAELSIPSVDLRWEKTRCDSRGLLRTAPLPHNMSRSPTLVLVPGGGQGPWAFARLIPELDQLGYTSHPVTLPCVGSETPDVDMHDDIAAIRKIIEDRIAQGEHVILVCHSFGAVEGSAATKGLTESAKGRGRVIGLVMICGVVHPAGKALQISGPPPPFVKVDGVRDFSLSSFLC